MPGALDYGFLRALRWARLSLEFEADAPAGVMRADAAV